LILSATERDTLLALPESQDDLIRYYTLQRLRPVADPPAARRRQRLGFAVQLSLLRYPGYALGSDSELPEPVNPVGGQASSGRPNELGEIRRNAT